MSMQHIFNMTQNNIRNSGISYSNYLPVVANIPTTDFGDGPLAADNPYIQNTYNLTQKSIHDSGSDANYLPVVANIPRTDFGDGPLAADNMYIQNTYNLTQKGIIDAGLSDFGSLESLGLKQTSYSNPKYDNLVTFPYAANAPTLDWGNNLLESENWQMPDSVKDYLTGGFQVGVTHAYKDKVNYTETPLRDMSSYPTPDTNSWEGEKNPNDPFNNPNPKTDGSLRTPSYYPVPDADSWEGEKNADYPYNEKWITMP